MLDSLKNIDTEKIYPGYHPWWHPKERADFGMLSTPCIIKKLKMKNLAYSLSIHRRKL